MVATTANTWDQFLQVSRPDIGFMQTTWWATFLEDSGWDHFGVVLKDGDQILGGARVLCRSFAPGKTYYYMPEGPVLPEDEADARQLFDAVLSYVDQMRARDEDTVSHLRIEPRWQSRPDFVSGCREARSWLEPRNTLHIDLSQSEAGILSQMTAKGRYNTRLARRHQVTVTQDHSSQAIADFLSIYNETTTRQAMSGKSSQYLESLCAWLLAADRGAVHFAEYRGRRLAAALIVYFGDRATYFFGGSRGEHREVMAPYLLHYEAILAAKARGHRWYDFYGTAPADQPDHKWAGISAFKRKFGGVELNFVPALDFIYDAPAYEAYRRPKSRTKPRCGS